MTDDAVTLARAIGALRLEFAEVRRAVRVIAEAVTALAGRVEKLEGDREQGRETWVH